MIRIFAVGFGPEPGQKAASSQGALTMLAAESWCPAGVVLDVAVLAQRWWPEVSLATMSRGYDAVLLFSDCGRDDGAVVARFARNAADPHIEDAAGYRWAGPAIAPGGAEDHASGLQPFALARAIELAGLSATASADCDAGVANKSFYDLLAAGCACALVRLPISIENARAQGRHAQFNRCEVLAGVQAAIGFAAAAAEVAAVQVFPA